MHDYLAAMGCPIGSFSVKRRFLIPEGPIDYFLLHGLLNVAGDQQALDPSIGLVPATNAGDVLLLSALYYSLGFEQIGLLDGDMAGHEVLDKATKKGLDKILRFDWTKKLFAVDYIESLFTYELYTAAAVEANNLDTDALQLLQDRPKDGNLKKHLQGLFKKHSLGTFSGLATAARLADKLDPLSTDPFMLDENLISKSHAAVEAIHKAFAIGTK